MRVAAVNPDSLVEAIIVGSTGTDETRLRRAAYRKLEYVLDKAAAKGAPERGCLVCRLIGVGRKI